MPKIEIEKRALRYRQKGPREATPPLVFVHGAVGGKYVWQAQFEGLPDTLRLVAPDLPGHGASDPPPRPYDIADHARVVSALMEALELAPAVLVGHSMGGLIAQQVALDHPEQVAGLVLVSTGAKLPVSDLIFGAVEHAFDTLGDFMRQTSYGPDTPPEVVDRYTQGPLQCTADTARADFEACQGFDVRDRLAQIALPCLVLGGTADALVGAGRWNQLVAGLPDAELALVPGAGHMVMQERPEVVNPALTAFVTQRLTPPQRP